MHVRSGDVLRTPYSVHSGGFWGGMIARQASITLVGLKIHGEGCFL